LLVGLAILLVFWGKAVAVVVEMSLTEAAAVLVSLH
jgi:hypothetical protein